MYLYFIMPCIAYIYLYMFNGTPSCNDSKNLFVISWNTRYFIRFEINSLRTTYKTQTLTIHAENKWKYISSTHIPTYQSIVTSMYVFRLDFVLNNIVILQGTFRAVSQYKRTIFRTRNWKCEELYFLSAAATNLQLPTINKH